MGVLGVVREAIQGGRMLSAGATVVVGVSGGADSLCLLHVLKRLKADYRWSLYIAHLNHCLRGAESDDDMVFVALLAMDWGLPCSVEVVDVKAVARRWRMSLEEAARQVRYGFLADVARQMNATAVAVGHNADDQSETVLMHFLRGAGMAGLRGMLPVTDLGSLIVRDRPLSSSSIHLVRPLLKVSREDIEAYCRAHNLSPRFDRSNLDLTFFRNRLRRQLLPQLETYNPSIKTLLRRMAAVAAADYELLTAVRDEAWAKVVREESKSVISFDLVGWRALPLALQRATLRKAAYRLSSQLRDVDFVHIAQAVNVAANGSTGAQATLPQGLRLAVGYQTIRLSGAQADLPPPDWPLLWRDEPLRVTLSGTTVLHDSEWRLDAQPWSGERDAVWSNADRWVAYLDADCLGPRLALRPRRPGDRFQPLGMGGQTVKVADWMIGAKIPRRWREHIPLLVHDRPDGAGDGEIAWVVGWRIDERVKVTDRTRRVLCLRLERKSK